MQQYQLISRWLQGQIPGKILPWQIDLDTTNICNQSCYYCNTEQFRNDNPVYQSKEKYVELLDNLANWRNFDPNVIGTTSNVIFSGGGEPTLLPGFEDVIEKSIDSGFATAINTNGTKLNRLLKIDYEKISRMAYIGLDIDSGNPDTYEQIRRSKMSTSPFNDIKRTATELGKIGAPLDIKALLMPENTSQAELNSIFEYARDVNARAVHLRPMVLDNKSFQLSDEIRLFINRASEIYRVKVELALGRYETREYSRCHQFFLFPSFCADGKIYLCCEYKGRPDICLGSWVEDNWRDLWCNDRHRQIYNDFRTMFCKPCRPNTTNNNIQRAFIDPKSVLDGFI